MMVHHHVKYKEIHGVDEVVLMEAGEHFKLHARLRREGKCNIPAPVLHKISGEAKKRREEYREYQRKYGRKYMAMRRTVLSRLRPDIISSAMTRRNPAGEP